MALRQCWIDEYHMRQAINLSLAGMRKTSPNPMVGCVIVKDGAVVGKGWHPEAGKPHAEVYALQEAGQNAKGATAYVTLEPCSHHGRTPPCAPALAASGISRCVIATLDPNPKVSGKGVQILKDAGIEVSTGVLQNEARWINRGFLSSQSRKRPWITVKAGMSTDSQIALIDGTSKWITNSYSRQMAHLLRAENDAIMAGLRTVEFDNPALSVRHTEGESPQIILLDKTLARITPSHKAATVPNTIIYTSHQTVLPESWPKELKDKIRFAPTAKDDPHSLDLVHIVGDLTSLGINRLMIEGGGNLISQMFTYNLVDEISLFMAPCFMGSAIGLTSALKVEKMDQKIQYVPLSARDCGGDLWVEGVVKCSQDWLKTLEI